MLTPAAFLVVFFASMCAGENLSQTQTSLTPALLRPDRLSVEYNSACVDSPAPRFSWIVVSAQSNATDLYQSAYEIQVVAEIENLTVWALGKQAGNQTLHVVYDGKELTSDTAYAWRVRVWDPNDMASEFSSWAHIHVAFLSAEKDWTFPWVTSSYNQLRSLDFHVDSAPVQSTMYFASAGYAQVFLNDVRINGKGDELGPWTTWTKRVLYRCYNASGGIRAGMNTIGVWLGHGQYASGWAHAWYTGKGKPPLAIRLQLNILFKNGSRLSVGTEKSWKGTDGPIIEDDIYAGETYDARLFKDGWSSPGYNTSNWSAAELLPSNAPTYNSMLSVHSFTPIRSVSTRFPVKLTNPQKAIYVYHFAENFVGWATINVKGPAGQKLILKFAEQMQCPNGTHALVDCEGGTIWYPFGGQEDSLILRGDEAGENLTVHFTYHGFQFVQVEGWPEGSEPTLSSLSAQVVHSENKPTAQLQFPDTDGGRLLSAVNSNIIRSLLSNMHSVESDCPTRERVGWTGDAQGTAETAIRNLDMASFYTKWMQDMKDSQGCAGLPKTCPQGALSSTIPYAKHFPPVDPTWPTVYPQLVRLMYDYYADLRLVETHYEAVKDYVDYVASVKECPSCHKPTDRQTQIDGLPWFYMNGDWMAWQPQAEQLATSGPILSSAFHILDTTLVAQFADILGKAEDKQQYEEKAEEVISTFNSVYLGKHDGKNLSYCTPCSAQEPEAKSCSCKSQTPNIVPLYLGFTPDNAKSDVLAAILNSINAQSGHLDTGFVGNKYILNTLSRFGYAKVALNLAMKDSEPSWGYQVRQGATTLWEDWTGAPTEYGDPNSPSHNHHFLGGCGQWFHEGLVGLKQVGSGGAYADMEISPEIMDDPSLPSMSGSFITPRGNVSVSWHCCPASVNVSIPPNTRATVKLPKRELNCRNTLHSLIVNGMPIELKPRTNPDEPLDRGDPISGTEINAHAPGLRGVQCKRDGSVFIRVGSGSYRFHVKGHAIGGQ